MPTLAPATLPGISPGISPGIAPANNIVPFPRGGGLPPPSPPTVSPSWSLPPLAGSPALAAPAAGAGIGVGGAIAAGVGALGVGVLAGEGIRQGGLALEDAGILPNSPLFQRYPWETGPNVAPAPIRNAIPPGAASPFSGGQSTGVPYEVYIRWDVNWPFQTPDWHRLTLSGPILGMRTTVDEYGIAAHWIRHGSPVREESIGSASYLIGQGTGPGGSNVFAPNPIRITRVRRLDGQPDTGGDPTPDPVDQYTPPAGFRPTPSLDPARPWLAPPIPALAPAPSPAPLSPPRPSPATPPDRVPALPGLPAQPSAPPSSPPAPVAPPLPGTGTGTGTGTGAAGAPGSGSQASPRPAPLPQPSKAPAPRLAPPNFDPCSLNPCHGGGEPGTGTDSALLQKIAQTVGVGEFPGTLPLLNGKGVVPVANIPQMVRWQVQAFDSVYGQFPLSVQVFQADGKVKTIRLENLAHSIDELFGMLLAVAEDADAAVNIGARNIVETIQAKIAAKQAGELATANQKFLGYNIKAVPREVKISVTPAAAGADNKLQNQEMTAFLEPSKQQYIGSEYDDSKQLLPIAERTLEDGEIARAALFRPVKVSKDKTGDVGLTGEFIRSSRGNDEILNKAWTAFLEQLKKEGYEVDGNKSKPK
jgi:hypothetical protein